MFAAGAIRYLNFLPLFAGIQEGAVQAPFRWVYGAPSDLNRLLREGFLHISPVSSAEFLQHSSRYILLPSYCIGAQERVHSVTLYSQRPVEQLDGVTIGLTSQSASSALLLRVLCHAHWHVEPRFVSFERNPTDFEAFLLIGDEALLHPEFSGYQSIDLATTWHAFTGLPFTFAVFAASASFAHQHPEVLRLFDQALHDSYAWGQARPDHIISLARQRIPLPEAQLATYFADLRYSMTPAQRDGLDRFAMLAKDLPNAFSERHDLSTL